MPGPNLKSHLGKKKNEAQARQKKAMNRRVQKLMEDTARYRAEKEKEASSKIQLGSKPKSTPKKKSSNNSRGNIMQAIRSRKDIALKY